MEGFNAAGIEIKTESAEPPADGGKEADAAGAAAGDGNEGGDPEEGKAAEDGKEGEDAEKKEEAAPAVMSPEKYDADDFAYGGWETVPAIFLKQAIVNGYWGDLVKGHIIHWEFN